MRRSVRKRVKILLKTLLSLLLVVVIAVAGYVGYVYFSYSRIADNQPIKVESAAENGIMSKDGVYKIINQNIGFGAYTKDFTFFMDGGTESWAESEQSVKECVNKAADKAKSFNADFVLFQEVDTDSTRSYHIDQREILKNKFKGYSSAFGVNYHSAFLMYPLLEPHGASNSGVLTFSKYKISSSLRRSLPISEGLDKFLDLDRCYTVTRIPLDNGKEFVLYNVHMSAYGSDESIRAAQSKKLFDDMKREYDKGNYCICAGDFNHDFTGDSTQKLNGGEKVEFGWAQPFPKELLPQGIVRCDQYTGNDLVPTCRNCDVPYKEGNFTIIVDGFLVSENVEVKALQNIDTGFEYSDHNPTYMEFSFK